MTEQKEIKPLSERKKGYFLAVFCGTLWVPFGWFASPLVLFILNKTMKKKGEKQPNRFLVWSVIGIASLPIQLSQLENSTNFLGGVSNQTASLNDNLQNSLTTVPPAPIQPDISMSDYQKIQNGMTYQEVVNILGKEGEERSSSSYYTIYLWNDGTGSGGNLTASFTNGRLTSKSQIGLK
jgi:hypothetical protein